MYEVGRAVFEVDASGVVDRIGIEFEPEMVRMAEEDGMGRREGMVWFERIG